MLTGINIKTVKLFVVRYKEINHYKLNGKDILSYLKYRFI